MLKSTPERKWSTGDFQTFDFELLFYYNTFLYYTLLWLQFKELSHFLALSQKTFTSQFIL